MIKLQISNAADDVLAILAARDRFNARQLKAIRFLTGSPRAEVALAPPPAVEPVRRVFKIRINEGGR